MDFSQRFVQLTLGIVAVSNSIGRKVVGLLSSEESSSV